MSDNTSAAPAPSTGSILNRHRDLHRATIKVGLAAADAASAWHALLEGNVKAAQKYADRLPDSLPKAEAAFDVDPIRREIRAAAHPKKCRHDYWLRFAKTVADYFDSDDMDVKRELARRLLKRRRLLPIKSDIHILKEGLFTESERAAELRESARAMEADTGVVPVSDDDSYVPATPLFRERFHNNYQKGRRYLMGLEGEVRWRKPHLNRLEVHLLDWHRHCAKVDAMAFQNLDSAQMEDYLADAAAMKEKAKATGRAKGNETRRK